MARRIEVEQPLSRKEKIKVTLGVAALGATATAATIAGIAHEAGPDTREEQVTIQYDRDTPTQWDAARDLREQGATESMRDLVSELDAVDPEQDNIVQPGQTATIRIDVPKE